MSISLKELDNKISQLSNLPAEDLLKNDIRDTIQYTTYTNDQITKIEHKRGENILRTDTFTYNDNLIIELRTLSTSETLEYRHHFNTDGTFNNTEVI